MTSLKITYKLKNSNHWEYFIYLLFFSLGCLIQGNLISWILKRKRQGEEWCIVTGIFFLLPLPTTQHCSNAPTTHSRGYGTITTYNPHGLWWANLLLSDLNHLRRLHAVYRTHMVILGLSLLEEATLPARNFSPLEVILLSAQHHGTWRLSLCHRKCLLVTLTQFPSHEASQKRGED